MDTKAVSEVYQQLDKHNLHLLEAVYHQDVVFEDPAHRVEGYAALLAYFGELYANVIRCDFNIEHHQQLADTGFITWTMSLLHPKLNSGQPVEVKGVSHLIFRDDLVIYHRDYFDLGQMLYEQVVLLGPVIKHIKQRLGS
ncbi:nuclear transport factor 2 family protein [Vibrio sp. E150_011]